MVECSEVLQCNDGTSNKVSDMIRNHVDTSKLLLICILYMLKVVNNTTRYKKNVYSRY